MVVVLVVVVVVVVVAVAVSFRFSVLFSFLFPPASGMCNGNDWKSIDHDSTMIGRDKESHFLVIHHAPAGAIKR